MRNFKKLRVLQDSMVLVTEVYKLANQLPTEEKYGLKSQICRAAVSIPSNIAEGSSKNSDTHLGKYLSISLGSAFELETQLLISQNLEIVDFEGCEEVLNKLNAVQRQIQAFINTLN